MDSFWENVLIAGDDECWLWTGSTRGRGYGQCYVPGRTRYAHILAWELSTGRSASGKVLRHTCDTPLCCNPRHLRAGTQAQNLADMRAKRRGARGMTHGRRRIDIYTARDIYDAVGTQDAIAHRFNVSQSLVSQIKRHIVWRVIHEDTL